MGAKPLPSNVKRLRNTDQPCRIRDDEPQPANDNLRKPRGLSKKAGKHWNTLVKMLTDCGIVTNVDTYALGMLAVAMAELYEIQTDLDKYGYMTRGRHNYPVISPLFRASMQKAEQVRKMMSEFGLTPSSRTRVGSDGAKKQKGEFDF